MASARANRIKRVAEKRKEGKSLRTIAEEEGVDPKTIQKDLKDAAGVDPSTPEPTPEQPPAPTGEFPQLKTTTGRDGKTYRQPPKAPATAAKPATVPTVPTVPTAPVDDSARLLRALTQQLTETAGLLSALAADPKFLRARRATGGCRRFRPVTSSRLSILRQEVVRRVASSPCW